MNPQIKNLSIILMATGLLACASQGPTSNSVKEEFLPVETVDETRQRIASLPDADVWVNVTGEHMGWLHRNVHKVFPTVNVYRNGPVRELAYNLMPEIGSYRVETPEGEMAFEELLSSDQSTVMGMVVLYRGEIVFETYPRQQFFEKPIFWSTTKVLVTSILSILEDRGLVDVTQPINAYIPELNGSPFEGILIRNILDMATGLQCPEDYSDPNSCYYAYSQSTGEGYWDESSPDSPYTYVPGLEIEKFAEQGTQYQYSGVNAFVIAWLIEKITGEPFQDVFTREIWQKIGAEADASMLAPRFGVPNTNGGFMSRIRDLGRFGLLFTPSYGLVSDQKIISDRHLEVLQEQGNMLLIENMKKHEAWTGDEDGMKHTTYMWGAVYDNGDMYQGGWGGQGLLVNPDKDLVAVWTGYFKDDYSEVQTLPIVRKVLQGVFPDYSEPVPVPN
jgi:hypothetical protein